MLEAHDRLITHLPIAGRLKIIKMKKNLVLLIGLFCLTFVACDKSELEEPVYENWYAAPHLEASDENKVDQTDLEFSFDHSPFEDEGIETILIPEHKKPIR